MTTETATKTRSFVPLPSATPLDIGVDLDGIGYEFVGALHHFAATHLGRNFGPVSNADTCSSFDFWKDDWNLTLEEFLQLGNDAAEAGILFTHGEPFAGFKAGLDRLLAAGHRIHIVTDRAGFGGLEVASAQTQAWLTREGINYTSLNVTADKTAIKTDVFIEDRPKYYTMLEEAGVDVFLRAWGYNAHVEVPSSRLVPDFTGFVNAVLRGENA